MVKFFSARKGFIRLLNSLSSLSMVRFLILRSDFVAILLSHFLKYDDAYLKIGGQLLKTRRKKQQAIDLNTNSLLYCVYPDDVACKCVQFLIRTDFLET